MPIVAALVNIVNANEHKRNLEKQPCFGLGVGGFCNIPFGLGLVMGSKFLQLF